MNDVSRTISDESMLLNLLLEHSGESCLVLDRDGLIINANDKAKRFIEASSNAHESHLGWNIFDLNTFNNNEDCKKELKAYLFSNNLNLGCKKFRFEGGYQLSIQSISQQTNLQYLLIISRNEESPISNEVFVQIADLTSDALIITNDDLEDTKILYVNEAFVKLTGYSTQEVLNKNPRILQGEKTSRKVLNNLKKSLLEGDSFKGSTYNYKKNGEAFINHWEIKKIVSSIGPSYYLTIINDVTEKEGVKEDLQTQEGKLKMIFEGMEEGIVFQDLKGTIIEHNKAAEYLLGLTYSQIIGRDSFDPRWRAVDEFSKNYPGEDHPISRSRLKGEVIKGGIMGIYTPKGILRWLSVNSRPTFNELGEQNGAFCTFSDISEEIKIKTALVDSGKRYRTLFEDNPNPLIISDLAHEKIIDVNKATLKFYGYSKSEFLKMSFGELDITKNNSENRFYLDSDKIHKTKSRIVYVSINSKEIQLDEQQLVIHQITDVTNRRLIEFKLLQQERKLADITGSTDYAVFEVDSEFKFTLFFGSILNSFKLKSEDILGKKLPKIASKYAIAFDPLLLQAHHGNGSFTFRFNNETFKCDYSTIMENKTFGGYRGFLSNVTGESKLKNELLEASNELKQAQNIVNIGSWTYNINSNKGSWTAMVQTIFGLDKDSALDLTTLELLLQKLSAHQKALLEKDFKRLKATKTTLNSMVKLEQADRDPKWIQLIASFQESDENELYGTIQDVTKEKKASEERIRLEQIIKNITNEVIIFSINALKPIYSNIAVNNNLGYNSSEMLELTIDQFIHEFEDIHFVEEVLIPRNGHVLDTQQLMLKFKRKDGSIYDAECTIQKLLANDEMVIVIIATDITEINLERKRKLLINEVNEIIVNASTLHLGIDAIISCLCRQLGFQGGAYLAHEVVKGNQPRYKWVDAQGPFIAAVQKEKMHELLGSSLFDRNKNVLHINKGALVADVKMSEGVGKSMIFDLTVLSFSNNTKVNDYLFLFSEDSKELVFQEFNLALKNIAGQVALFINAKVGEAQLVNSLKEKEILLKEIHHRVKNNLQTVSSLLYLKSYEIEDSTIVNFLGDMQKRISAISFTHEKLLKSSEFKYLDSQDYFEDLIFQISSTYKALSKIDFHYEIESIMLETDVIMNMGLVINEVITNSLKHAFVDAEKGVITVKLQMKAPGLVSLFISDDGKGLELNEVSKSTGMQLIEIFVEQLDGALEIKSEQGLSFSIDFKIQKYD